MRKYYYFSALFLLFSSLLFIDFYTKGLALTLMPLSDFGIPIREIPVFDNFFGVDFSLYLVMNKGMAWGTFQNFQYLILALRIVAIALLFFYLFFIRHEKRVEIPLLLIITGAFGNVIDFFLYGSVVDFLRFNLWGYHFPVFNVADSLITIGVITFFLLSLFKKSEKSSTHVKS